jgi:PAS domain-containing protein
VLARFGRTEYREVDGMAQREIEVILTRQLASCLTLPIFIVGPDGTLIFYNEPAEAILGHRFEETGEMPAKEWSSVYRATDSADQPVPGERLPLMIALREHRPAHDVLWIRGRDQVRRRIATTAFPLIGQAGRHLGAVAIFWEVAP